MDKTRMLSPFFKFKEGLSKTRTRLTLGLEKLLHVGKPVDPKLIEQVETLLLQSDIGIHVTEDLISQLTDKIKNQKIQDSLEVWNILKKHMQGMLQPFEQPIKIEQKPYVLLVVGVNGSGKTTILGKLALHFKQRGFKCLLAAGDTFRAASVEQLEIWGERNQIPVVSQKSGSDSAAVIYDAVASAKAKGIDIVLADTAGRLHTKLHLMDELKKVIRVIKKIDLSAPHEIMLVLDATIGQNALNQAHQFHNAVGLTGVSITKLDGTAKGGIIFAIAKELKLPIRFIGLGEGIEDLKEFQANQFVEALFGERVSD